MYCDFRELDVMDEAEHAGGVAYLSEFMSASSASNVSPMGTIGIVQFFGNSSVRGKCPKTPVNRLVAELVRYLTQKQRCSK